jgi:hypothetical protein
LSASLTLLELTRRNRRHESLLFFHSLSAQPLAERRVTRVISRPSRVGLGVNMDLL